MQIREETETHFYDCEKKIAEEYARENRSRGYKVETIEAQPSGYIVKSSIWIRL